MSNILNSEDFGLKIYNRFPPKYREDDVGQNFALKRYLQALADGGFKYSIDEINGITHLIDPDRVDARILPILYKQYGLDIFNGIPEEYLRYLLPKLGEAWSKKGSLSVIEFVTSSLSGIKTTTDVTYDDFNNPLIDVKLEMDYSIGDYFPDVEQFTRLLENFIPFYCDMNLIYSYLFYETQILRAKDDYDIMNILDHREEKGLIPHSAGERFYPQLCVEDRVLNSTFVLNEPFKWDIDPDYHEDSIITHILESGGLTREHSRDYYKQSLNTKTLNSTFILNERMDTDEFLDKIKYPLIAEKAPIRGADLMQEKVSVAYSESGVIRLAIPLENDEQSALLGEAIMGLAVLGSTGEDADVHRDAITEVKEDIGNVLEPIDTRLNSQYNTLNGGFYTNGLYCYDIITVGGVKEVII